MFKRLSLTILFTLLATSNSVFAAASPKDQALIRLGSSCGSNQVCTSQLYVSLGYFLGRYNEAKRLNEISCDAGTPGKADRIICQLTKFGAPKDDCYQQTDEVVLNFFTLSGHPNFITVPKIESETGFRYSCDGM